MQLVIIILSLMFSFTGMAEHREHAAHVHGSGNLGIAFDGGIGKIDFKIPSESILGFEHSAKSEKDKKTMKEELEKLESKFSEMVVFESSLNCQFSKEKVDVINHGKHSETVANFTVNCSKSPEGTKIVFNFQKFFPRIKDLDVLVLVGSQQRSIEAKQSGTIIELK